MIFSRKLTLSPHHGSKANETVKINISQGNGRKAFALHDNHVLENEENAARERDEDEDEQDEFDHRHPSSPQERRRHALDQPEEDAAEQRTARIAETAKHGHDEAFELIGAARQHGERK